LKLPKNQKTEYANILATRSKRIGIMKKTLLTTTAVALTGFAGAASAMEVGTAGAVTLNIGGYFTTNIAIASVDAAAGTDYDGMDILTNSEIHFKPSITLDNGITFGADIELEGNTSGDQIDEQYVYAKGSFGKIIVGSENSVGYKMSLGAPDVSLIGVNSGSLTAFVPFSSSSAGADIFRGTLGSTYLENDRNNDAQRISYFSPSFGGFAVGISYARDASEGNGAVNNNSTTTDFVDVAASYGGSMGGMDLGLYAHYGTASAAPGGTDPEVWGGGINLGFGGFTFGTSYGEQDGTTDNDGNSFDVGVKYANGPWSYSLTYFEGTNADDEAVNGSAQSSVLNANGTITTTAAVPGIPGAKETLKQVIAAATYKVNGNFKVSAFIADVDFDEDIGTDTVEGTVVGFGAKFSF